MENPNFERTNPVDVYSKTLTRNDMDERWRLYIAQESARQLCPEAFAGPPGNEFRKNIVLHDGITNPLTFHFHKRGNGNRCYLENGWRDFLENKNKGPGDVVKIQKYEKGTGDIVFLIGFGSGLLMGALSFA